MQRIEGECPLLPISGSITCIFIRRLPAAAKWSERMSRFSILHSPCTGMINGSKDAHRMSSLECRLTSDNDIAHGLSRPFDKHEIILMRKPGGDRPSVGNDVH